MYEPSPEDTALRPFARPAVRRAADARKGVRSLITRYFFGVAALVALAGALLFALLPQAVPPAGRALCGSGYALLAVMALLLMAVLRKRPHWAEGAMLLQLAAAHLVIAGTAVVVGWGLQAPGFAFYPVFVCLLCTAANRHLGLWLALLSVTTIVAVHLASPPAADGTLRLLALLLLVATGLACGLLISYVVARYVRSADDREQRFRGLLGIAADAYWEIDADYRLVTGTDQRDESRSLTLADGLGRRPWDMPQFGCDGETLDAVIADLDTRAPFRNRLVHWQPDGFDPVALMVSGEPRFDERGVFKGYWGVARNVTAELQTRQAWAATETRYQELFARIPTPLVLHRDGRILDANPAALALLGCNDLSALAGRDLLAAYESGDSRERERRRFDDLAEAEAGAALPVADFRLLPRHGRRISVRTSSVQVLADGGPATLSIYVDDTERRSAEETVRRSEAMLSHLVATSPDLITLTDAATGRFAMVNHTFERLTGYSAAEVVGRSALDIGLWRQPEDRTRFIAAVRERGMVLDWPAEFVTKFGGLVSMRMSGARFAMDRREYLVVNARDVSDAERARLEREAILDNASIGIAVTRDRRFVLANPRFEQMCGWPRGTLVGQPGHVVWANADDYAEIGRAVGPALSRGDQVELERRVQRHDGSSFLARLLARAIDPTHPAKGGTVWIVEDVTERRQFEQALAAARDAAEAANRAKSAFLANTSHELRTPLNGVLHLAHLARDPALDAGRRDQYLEQIADSAQSLADIISDILDLSKIEAGKLEVERLTFELGDLLRSVQRGYATLAAARDLALGLDIAPGADAPVLGDPLRVRQILSNFLSNALKFTAAGSVQLRARRGAGERVRFEVQDTGPGIEPEVQARLFRPFTQADESTTRRFGGTGLGLSICRELALLMGGEVGVDSAPGRGSLFWAELPLPRALPPAAPARPGVAPVRTLQGARVLMVEDNPVNMMIAVALLERWGLQVGQASDGQEAVEAVLRAAADGQPFDAVLMDVQMPVMSGYEATQALRRHDAGRRLPVIALTAAALVSERQAAMDAGMDDFLTKPIDADRLHAALTRWVAHTA